MNLPRNMFTDPPRLPMVAPSILSADFARLGEACSSVLTAGADLLHLDVMDGHFVPNLTMGPALCASLRSMFPSVLLDVHLMVQRPEMFVQPFADAGASHLTFHIEVVEDPAALAVLIHAAGMTAGLAINPPTDVQRILPWINRGGDDAVDLVLVMSVNPGFSGQAFIESSLLKTRRLAPLLRPDQRLEMDGGINSQTAARCVDAGCDVLVAASAVFGVMDHAAAISQLRAPIRSRPAASR